MSCKNVTINNFRKIAYRYLKKRKYPEPDCEDFAQYACIRKLENPKVSQLQWLLVDYMREVYGFNKSIEDKQNKEDTYSEFMLAISQEKAQNEQNKNTLEIERALASVPNLIRSVLVLNNVWGMSPKEIGFVFDIDSRDVCRIINSEFKVSEILKGMECNEKL